MGELCPYCGSIQTRSGRRRRLYASRHGPVIAPGCLALIVLALGCTLFTLGEWLLPTFRRELFVLGAVAVLAPLALPFQYLGYQRAVSARQRCLTWRYLAREYERYDKQRKGEMRVREEPSRRLYKRFRLRRGRIPSPTRVVSCIERLLFPHRSTRHFRCLSLFAVSFIFTGRYLAKLVSVHATHENPATTRPAAPPAREVVVAFEERAMPDPLPRFVALDVHKAYVVIGAVDGTQTRGAPTAPGESASVYQGRARRPLALAAGSVKEWALQHLLLTDQVVLETTINAWTFYDQLVPLVSRVVVANPAQVKLIAASLVKTDKRDTLALARLLAANLIPAVWVPPPEVRELRALVTHRQRLLKQRTMAKNRLQSLLHHHNLTPPFKEVFAPLHRAWWEALEQGLSSSERVRVQQDRALVAYLTSLIETVEAKLAQLSQQEPWHAQVPFLLQLPGIGLITAMTVLASIGDVTRFASAKHLVGYAGLGARIHASGQVQRSGSITKSGRTELRTVLVEAAWTSVRTSPWWRARFTALTARMPAAKAIVAIARKLLVVIWHVLTARAADRQADPVAVARRLFRWGSVHRLATQRGLGRGAFVRYYLDQIGVGQELTHLFINGFTFTLEASG